MQNTEQKNIQENKKDQETVREEQAEAFKHFMEAHFCYPCRKESFNKFL